jgi:drug/metabolite transporter (DMT)-like permease
MTQTATATTVDQSDPLGGIVAMIAAMTCFIFSDVFAKLASETLPVGEVIAVRGVFSTLFSAVPVLIARTLPLLLTKFNGPWLIRVGGEMLAALGFISALAHMPIANVVSITQTIPLAMTAAGAVIFGEIVGWRRWSATIIGFLGVLLIVKPGSGDFSWWSLGAVLCVFAVTVRDIATRRLGAEVPASLITFTTAIGVTFAGAGLGVVQGGWSMPSPLATLYLASAAATVSSAYYFSILAIRKAPLSVVAPFRYTIIPLSLIAGYLVWNTVPDSSALLGIAIIAASGLYTFLRQQRTQKASASS